MPLVQNLIPFILLHVYAQDLSVIAANVFPNQAPQNSLFLNV